MVRQEQNNRAGFRSRHIVELLPEMRQILYRELYHEDGHKIKGVFSKRIKKRKAKYC
jgi:hypothetical protein